MTSTTPEQGPWKIALEPRGQNPGRNKKNDGGMIVYLSHQRHGKQEVHRVAFVRENSSEPDASFDDKLDKVVATARKAADTLNELDAGTNPGELV